jgi:hypothetical protein
MFVWPDSGKVEELDRGSSKLRTKPVRLAKTSHAHHAGLEAVHPVLFGRLPLCSCEASQLNTIP